MNDNDGVSLISTSHPIAPWWLRLWFWLRRRDISKSALETVELELPERRKW